MSDSGSDNDPGADLSEEQMAELQEAFNVFDIDSADTITTRKLFRVMRALGQNPTEAEVQDLINAVDDDGNGTIEFEEFVAMMAQKVQEPDTEDDLRQAFKVFDPTNQGTVGLEDLQQLLASLGHTELGPAELQEMIKHTDSTGQGALTVEDFIRLYNDT